MQISFHESRSHIFWQKEVSASFFFFLLEFFFEKTFKLSLQSVFDVAIISRDVTKLIK